MEVILMHISSLLDIKVFGREIFLHEVKMGRSTADAAYIDVT
jgi:hypothetical protein